MANNIIIQPVIVGIRSRPGSGFVVTFPLVGVEVFSVSTVVIVNLNIGERSRVGGHAIFNVSTKSVCEGM